MRALLIAAVICVSAPFGGAAFAQAGSTGGTLGNTDKSISGEREEPRRPEKREERHQRPQAAQSVKTFLNPSISGVHVDRCWHFATECDEPAATAWCRSKGLTHAVAWKWENMSDTIGQSDGRRCPTPGACGGFTVIVCE
jgi:hypothetical protein